MQLEVVTPDGKFFNGEVESVSLPSEMGEIEIYPGHVNLMTEVRYGEMKIKKEGVYEHFALGEGFVQVCNDKVSILTDLTVNEKDINDKKLEEAIERAKKIIASENVSEDEMDVAKITLIRSITQMKVKRKGMIA